MEEKECLLLLCVYKYQRNGWWYKMQQSVGDFRKEEATAWRLQGMQIFVDVD
jgi:hypothetical protein